MFNALVDIEPFVSGANAAAREEYTAYYICVYEVNPECKNDRSLVVMSKNVLPGMTNPVGLNSGNPLRQTLALSTHANLSYSNPSLGLESCENVVPGAGNNSKLQVAHNKCSIAKLSNLPDSHWAACGWRISLMAQCYHDVVTSDEAADQHAPRAVQDGDRTLRKMREQKLGEVFLANSDVGLCLTQATRETPTVQLRLPIVSNDSHVLDAFNKQNRFVDIYVRPLVLRTEQNLLFECEIQKWQAAQEFRQTLQQDYVQKYYAQYHKLMDIYTKKCFPQFGETQNLSPRQLQVVSETKYLPRGICPPLQPGMTRFHVPEWITYPIDETFGTTTALPIWMYSLPRSNFGANLPATDPRFLNSCAFLKRLLIASANSYNTSPSELFEIFTRFSSVQTQKTTEKDKATLLTVREVVAHFLTLASFMGKYRSDFAISPTGKIQPTESCDLNRISGESISDDCEGCEGVTREVFLMLLDFAPRLKDSNDVTDRALCAMAKFLDLHYEYLSASGSTTAAYPGCNIHGEAQGLSQTEAFFESRSGNPHANRHTLRKMMYGSEEDQNAEVGFHQYSVLMPSRHMVEMMKNTVLDNAKFGTNTELLSNIRDYYEPRAQESERVLGAELTPMLQPIVLESTWPVSTFLVGPSAYLASAPVANAQKDTSSYNVFEKERWSEYAKRILKCDELAAADAPRLRKVTSTFSGIPARCKDLHNLRILGAHFHPQDSSKAYRFKEDSERYTTLFYRHLCHTVNVSLMRNLQDKFSVAVRGAMSYSTWFHGTEECYGVPLEHLLLTGLPKDHPFANKVPHSIFHPFLRTSTEHLEKMGEFQDLAQFEAHLPPVLIGTATDMKEEDYNIQKRDFALKVDTDSFAERVLNARIVMIEGMSGPDYKETESRVWQTMSTTALNSDVPSPTVQRFKLFDVFGDFVSFISTMHPPE